MNLKQLAVVLFSSTTLVSWGVNETVTDDFNSGISGWSLSGAYSSATNGIAGSGAVDFSSLADANEGMIKNSPVTGFGANHTVSVTTWVNLSLNGTALNESTAPNTNGVNKGFIGLRVSTTANWWDGANVGFNLARRADGIWGYPIPAAPWVSGWNNNTQLGFPDNTGGAATSSWFKLEMVLKDTGGSNYDYKFKVYEPDGITLASESDYFPSSIAVGATLYGGYHNGFAAGTNATEKMSKVNGILLDDFAFSAQAMPVTNTIVASIDLTRKRSIGGTASLDREQWFGVYHETGYGRSDYMDGGTTMTRDEWIYEEGRMWPSRGTVNFENMTEDPARDSYVDPLEYADLNGLFDFRYAWAKTVAPTHKTVFSGEGHGKYPAYMCWDTADTHNVKTVSNNFAHAEAITNILAQLDSRNGLMPHWFEVMNESSIQNNYGWHWDSDAWDKLSEFHATVADAVHASAYSNTVKVAGPTDAYPFRDDSDGDFSQWEGSNKKFIELAGDRMDAYAIHTYEQMTPSSAGNSSFDDQFSRFEIWHLGRLPSFIDLWQTEHNIQHGGTLPFVFSEYGLLNNDNPNGDRNAYYQIRSCNGILLSLLDRPDVIDKMSAFLMSQAPYNWNQKRVFFASEDSGATMYKTSYFEYLRFWHDLEGDYLFSSADSQHVAQHAFLSGNTNLFVVMKNNYNQIFNIDLQSQLPAGVTVSSAELQRIYYNGVDDVARDPFFAIAVSNLSSVAISPDETIMFKLQLAAMPALLTWDELNAYSDRTLVPMTAGSPEDFEFDVPSAHVEAHSAGVVHLSLYSFNGFASNLTEVAVNGTVVTNVPDISHTAGAIRSWKQIEVPVPSGVLQKGLNTVTVTPSESGDQKKISSVRLTVTGALGDEDSDDMPDWWEMENSLNPFVNDANGHSDADGISNADEFIAGTDPNNENSYLYVTPAENPSGIGYRIAFPTTTNRSYAVEVKESLTSGSWEGLTNGISGINDLIEIQDTQSSTQRYYRIRVGVE